MIMYVRGASSIPTCGKGISGWMIDRIMNMGHSIIHKRSRIMTLGCT